MKALKLHLVSAASAFILSVASAGTSSYALDLNPFSALKGAIEAAIEDRSGDDIAKDAEIRIDITTGVIKIIGTDVISINADVYEQDVMLTGVVESDYQHDLVEAFVGTVEGVKKIHNMLMVKQALDEEKGTVENFIDDSVIETKINALLLDAKGVNVTNFRWRSVGGHVFLFGRALSGAERTKATNIVRDIENVTSVKSLTKVKPLEE
jgi:hyperosmotically inducible protein